MSVTRHPVTPAPVPMCLHGGCTRPAEWLIEGEHGDSSRACTEHVGAQLAPSKNTVRPITPADR